MTLIFLLIALQLKHFIIDFPLQTKYQLSNKGTYGHPGGILHALLHGLATVAILWYFTGSAEIGALLGAIDAIVHYHIDWAKIKINQRFNLHPEWDTGFWILLGLDQLLHQLTYVGFLFVLLLV